MLKRKKRKPGSSSQWSHADFRQLVFLETAAKQLKPQPVRRAPVSVAETAVARSGEAAPDLRQLQLEGISDDVPLPRVNNVASCAPTPAARSVLLVVDQRLNMFFGSNRKMKSVVAAEAAALVAWRALAQDERIGALVFNDTRVITCMPNYSRLQVMLILHALLKQNHLLSRDTDRRSNPGMFNDALRRAEKLATRDFLIVVITDTSGHDEETQRLLANISRHNKLMMAVVYDPRQIGSRNTSSFISPRGRVNGNGLIGSDLIPGGISGASLSTRDDIVAQLRRAFRKSFRPYSCGVEQNGNASQTPKLPVNPPALATAHAKPIEVKPGDCSLIVPPPVETQQPLCA